MQPREEGGWNGRGRNPGDRGKPNRAQNKAKKKHRKKRKIKEKHSEGYWFSPLFLSLQKTQNQQPIHSRPATPSSSWFQKSLRKTKRKRRQSEHRRKIKGNHRRGSISTASVFGLQHHQVSKPLLLAICKFN